MAVLGLRFCARAPRSCGKWGPLLIAVRSPLTIAASRCGAQAPDAQAQQPWLTGPAAPRHVGSSQARARTCVSCISRQVLNHCATREAPSSLFWPWSFFSGHAAQLAGSYFPDQGLNPGPQLWKHRVLTTGQPGNSQPWSVLNQSLLVFLVAYLLDKGTELPSLVLWLGRSATQNCWFAHIDGCSAPQKVEWQEVGWGGVG